MNTFLSIFSLSRRLQLILLAFLCVLVNIAPVRAQEQAVAQTYLSRLSGADNTLINTASATLNYSSQGEVGVTIRNIITLSINEASQAYIPANFTATVTVKIDYAPTPSSAV